MNHLPQWHIGQMATWACLLEVQAAKVGNVHPGQSFHDLSWLDFAIAAIAIGPVFEQAQQLTLGQLILKAAEATKQVTSTNTNLGILLLLAPLAQVPDSQLASPRQFRRAVRTLLQRTTVADAEAVYAAIRLLAPSGMGQVPDQDLQQQPTHTLTAVMHLARHRDLVASQYASGFKDILVTGLTMWKSLIDQMPLETAIQTLHLSYLAAWGDSLISRKLGQPYSVKAQTMAQAVLASGWPTTRRSQQRFLKLDHWLRADGHRRNPGSTADLVAATMFASFRLGWHQGPHRTFWSDSMTGRKA